MKRPSSFSRKLLTQAALARKVKQLQSRGGKAVFTNGCFDILHAGHVRYLEAARGLGDALVVAVNSDASVRRIKGPSRPLNRQRHRLELLAALECVTWLCLFGSDTPLGVIRKVRPDVLVKGGDWPLERIVGREEVERNGGKVISIPLVADLSTTGLLRKIRKLEG